MNERPSAIDVVPGAAKSIRELREGTVARCRRLSTWIAICLLLIGCGSGSSLNRQKVVERIQKEAAGILKKDAAKIDVAKPLLAQGADELDIVELVMAVEDAFKVEIPDKALGEKISDVSKSLTCERLAEIVVSQSKIK